MRVSDAVAMIADGVDRSAAAIWADLGCGRGTFTLALAELLADGSAIHAVDTNAAALRAIPATHHGVSITTWHADFQTMEWPFNDLDGVILANSLHYAHDQAAAVRRIASHMRVPRFLIVEYQISSRQTPGCRIRSGGAPSARCSPASATGRSACSDPGAPRITGRICTRRSPGFEPRAAFGKGAQYE